MPARSGISIGEAAGFALLERDGRGADAAPRLLGYGESSDAHHMSTPHPDGARRRARARRRAGARRHRRRARSTTSTCTAPRARRTTRSRRRWSRGAFRRRTHASSTKGLTGHTLGAAGIVEAAASLLAIEHGLLPGTVNTRSLDPACGPQLRIEASARRGAHRAEQLVRLRRQQLRPGVRRAEAADERATNAMSGLHAARQLVRRRHRLLGADAARLGRGARRVPRRRRAARNRRPSARRPRSWRRAERRRAPDTVALALEVAAAAVRAVGPRPRRRCPRSSPRRTATSPSTTTCARRWRASRR